MTCCALQDYVVLCLCICACVSVHVSVTVNVYVYVVFRTTTQNVEDPCLGTPRYTPHTKGRNVDVDTDVDVDM